MKNKRINLHINHKRTLLTMVFFSLISFLVLFIVSIAVKKDYSQLRALIGSKYEYSVITNSPVGQDDFIKYSAGIYFTVSNDSQSSLNVDVIMQSEDTVYTDNIFWNARNLEKREVAITKNIAVSNNIKVGDVLISKHIVDGSLQEYKVSEILPDVMNIRSSKVKSYTSGIIIMGYDPDYYRNVSNNNLVYTNKTINELSDFYPEDIIYREDEIVGVMKRILPYLIVEIIISIVLCVGLCVVLSKQIEKNFLRQLMLGFPKVCLNSSYFRFVCLASIISVIFSFAVLVAALRVLDMSILVLLKAVGVFLIENIIVVSTTFVLNKKLWRR